MSAAALMHTLPLDRSLPAVTPSDARLTRLACDRRLAAWLGDCLGETARVRVGGPMTGTLRLSLQVGGGMLDLLADATALPALGMAAAIDDSALATEVGRALMAPWLRRLAGDLPGLELANLRAQTAGQVMPALQGCGLALGLVAMDAAAGACLTDLLRRLPSPPGPQLAPLALRGRVRLFIRTLPLDELSSLAEGDILIGHETHRSHLPWRGQALFGREFVMQAAIDIPPDSASGTLAHAPSLQPEHAGSEGPDLQRLGDMGLPVAFEIDTACISLNELAALDSGSVVELHASLLDAPVRLVCYGQVVGLGQLVAVGERLGVRIQRMGVHAAAGLER